MARTRATDGISLFGGKLLLAAVILYCLAIPLWWLVGGYLTIPVTTMLSFLANDGWCEPYLEGIGVHCFGDHSIVSQFPLSTGAWSGEFPLVTAYAPLGLLPHALLSSAGPFHISVAAGTLGFLVISSLFMMLPAIWAARRASDSIYRVVILLIVGIGSMPMLITLDRGNLNGILVGLLFLLVWFQIKNRNLASGAIFALMVAMKPPLVLLSPIFIWRRQFRVLIYSWIGAFVGVMAGFVLWPGGYSKNFSAWLANFTNYKDSISDAVYYPYNLSLGHSIHTIVELPLATLGMQSEVAVTISSFSTYVSLVMFGATLYLTLVFPKSEGYFLPVSLVVSLMILVMPVAFHYYLGFMLVPVALLVRDGMEFGLQVRRWTMVGAWILVLALALLLVPLPIPLRWLPVFSSLPGSEIVPLGAIQIAWGPILLLIWCVCAALMFGLRNQKRKGDAEYGIAANASYGV